MLKTKNARAMLVLTSCAAYAALCWSVPAAVAVLIVLLACLGGATFVAGVYDWVIRAAENLEVEQIRQNREHARVVPRG